MRSQTDARFVTHNSKLVNSSGCGSHGMQVSSNEFLLYYFELLTKPLDIFAT